MYVMHAYVYAIQISLSLSIYIYIYSTILGEFYLQVGAAPRRRGRVVAVAAPHRLVQAHAVRVHAVRPDLGETRKRSNIFVYSFLRLYFS